MGGGTAGPLSAHVMVTRDDVDQMNALFEKTWRRPPTALEHQVLIDDFVRSEIYYREAIAMGLDRGDDVIKRRLRQKMEFIFEDISSLAEPTDADLDAFMQAHPKRYATDPQVAFLQVYINESTRGARADADARQELARLQAGANPASTGDPTMLPGAVPLSAVRDIEAQFGEDFGRSLLTVAQGSWAGPIRSGFGLHLVFVRQVVAGELPALQQVRESVQRDWMTDQQSAMKDAAYAKLKARYTVTMEPPKR